MTQITLTSGSTWTPPVDCPAGSVLLIETWGAGSGGSGRVGSAFGAGGAGGDYVSASYTLTSGDVASGVPIVIGAGSAGTSGVDPVHGGHTIFGLVTNIIANSNMAGAVTGTPGTLPVGWAAHLGGNAEMSIQVVAIGTDSSLGPALPYIDLRFFGTPTATNGITIFYPNMPVAGSVSYTGSVYTKLVAGSLTNVPWSAIVGQDWDNYSANITNTSNFNGTTPFGLTGTLTRYSVSTTSNAASQMLSMYFQIGLTSGSAIDLTVRIAAPQLELGATAGTFQATPYYVRALGGFPPLGLSAGDNTGAFVPVSPAPSGTVVNLGGPGAGYNSPGGSGGGGAGGKDGAGNTGTFAGVGGQGDATTGGIGGAVKTTSPGNAGAANIEGGGGGGSLTTVAGTAGAGGAPGGGGGAAIVATGTGGAGARGQIRITYTPVGTISVTRDYIIPAAFSGTVPVSTVLLPIEWAKSLRQDSGGIAEWRNPLSADIAFVTESRSAIVQDATVPAEWRLSVSNVTRDAVIPLEWGATGQRDASAPVEWRTTSQMDAVARVDWSRQHAVHYLVPVAFGQPVTGDDATINASWSSQIAADTVVSPEWLAFTAISANQAVPIEWTGIITVVADALIPLEWRSTFVADSTPAIENTRTHIQSHSSPVSWGQTIVADTAFPAAWGYGILADQVMLTDWRIATVTGDSRMVLEWALTAQADSTAASEWGKTVAGDLLTPMSYTLTLARDAAQPVEFSMTRLGDVLLPLDLGGGQGSVANVSVPVEWRSGVFADMPAVLGYSASVTVVALAPMSFLAGRSADYVAGVAWLASPFRDAAIPVSWLHLELSATRDDRFALEFLQSVVTDITVTYTLDVGRESIGASLAPDEWECEHEP